VFGQQLAGVGDGLSIRVQVPLCRAQRSVPRDQPQVMNRHPGIRHPGQPRMPKAAPRMLIANADAENTIESGSDISNSSAGPQSTCTP
jgi:hypothetical protein